MLGGRLTSRSRTRSVEKSQMSVLGLDCTDVEEQRLLLRTLNALGDGLILVAGDCKIAWVNEWLEARLVSQMPLVGKRCDEVFPGILLPCLGCDAGSHSKQGRFPPQVVAYPSALDPTCWLELLVTCLEDTDRNRVGGVVHVKDITEHKLSEELLTDEISRRRLLVEQSSDGIVVLDESGKVTEANQQFAHMLGYLMEEMGSLYVWDWDAAAPKARLQGQLASVDMNGDHFETRHRRKDGTQYEVEISTNGATFGGRKYVFCVCRDITERKQAEKEREALIRELQDALAEIRALRGLVPVCCYCNKIRDDKGSWESVDVYIARHSAASVTHGICPECMNEHFPQLCGDDE